MPKFLFPGRRSAVALAAANLLQEPTMIRTTLSTSTPSIQHPQADDLRRQEAANDGSQRGMAVPTDFAPEGELHGGVQPMTARVETESAVEKRRLARVVGARLARARISQGLTQIAFAKLINHKISTQISLWEAGHRLPTLLDLIAASRALGCSVDFLLGETTERSNDAIAGSRAAMIRGLRNALDRTVGAMADVMRQHTELVGPGVAHFRGLLAAASDAAAASDEFVRLNHAAFDELRGGARLLRAMNDLDTARLDARRRLDLHNRRDLEIAEALADLHKDDIELPQDEP